jgi:hypothetical protein
METDKKSKQQAEWLATYTMTKEQFQKLIVRKLERNAQLQCKKKSHKGSLIAC